MNTFQIILKKILKIDNIVKIYDINIIKDNNNYDFFIVLTSCIFIQKSYSIQTKFNFLNESLKNIFVTHEIKTLFLNLFCKVQKIYRGFSKLALLYKYKKAKLIIEYDLCLNSIKENDKNVFVLFQNNNKYLFNINDLIKIIHNSIANTSHFFNNPLPIKNPYNNVILNKSTLYNIYFYIRTQTLLNPDLLFYFFKTNFNINQFTENHKFLIRNYAINIYLINSSNDKLHEDTEQMIETYNYSIINKNNKIIIDDEFPKDLLIKIMKPYLHIFFLSEYSLLNANGRMKYKKLLQNKLMEFQNFNPTFGRKIVKYVNIMSQQKILRKTVETFNSKHIVFHDKNKEKKNFMESHNLKYKEDPNIFDLSDEDDDGDEDEDDPDFFEDENLTVIQNSDNNFININNSLYLINAYQTDEESNFYDELNNNILQSNNNLNINVIENDHDNTNNNDDNDNDSFS